jgi:DEAD/DEAH box helicase domain-containing protein
VGEFLQVLCDTRVLHHSAGRYYWMADHYPARDLSLRSASPEPVLLHAYAGGTEDERQEPVLVGQVDEAGAHWMTHPGAVYLHQGQQYLVEELDLDAHLARLRPVSLDYYTRARTESTVELVECLAHAYALGATRAYGDVRVTRQVVGYRKVRWFTHEQLGMGDVDLPPTELLTTAYWLSPDEETLDRLREEGLWNNDPNDYGPDWAAQREAARARDAHRCQVCGAPESAQAHHVHHVVPFRSFASSLQANHLSNLVTLCPRCHQRAEQAVKTRSGLSGLASLLGHLAPLFLMCDAGDLGVHADVRSPLAEGRPTIVVYDGIPAGIGFSQRLYEMHDALMGHAHELVASCPCADGCPSCVGPAGEGGMGGKAETLALLRALAPSQQGR